MQLTPGSQLGPYRIDGLLGTGGMGAVYRGFDPRLQRPVAIKLLAVAASDRDARARLLREARSCSALNHPHICTIYDVGEVEGLDFIAMEFVDGQTLHELAQQGPLLFDQVVRTGCQVADALAHAHARGIVHRDLKAANVILASDGRVKVVDFGIATRVDAAGTQRTTSELAGTETSTGPIVGTVYAMAPEQLRADRVDARTDIWALGVLLQEIAAGAPPFSGQTTFELTSAILRDPPAPLPAALPAWFRTIVPRCLEKEAGRRYQKAADVLADLEALKPSASRGPSAEEPHPPAGPHHARPLPPLLQSARAGSPTFVGRQAELEQLERVWQQDRVRHRHMLALAGEPGIGKTRLAAEFCVRRHADGALVLAGRCQEEALSPYQPFIEALEAYIDVTPLDELGLQVDASGGALEVARLLPALARLLPDLPKVEPTDPESQRYRLFEAVSGLLTGPAGGRPVVLWIDDLHWADKPTLLLLRHVLRASGDSPLVVVATYRDTELGRTHPLADLLADLRRDQKLTRVALRGLPDADVGGLIASWIGRRAAPDFVHLVVDETAGNPFFISEILRHLSETGALDTVDSGWLASAAPELRIPEGVKEVIGRRLSRLSESCNRVLTLASVAGREFEFSTLEQLGELGDDELLDALDTAVQAGLIAEVPGAAGRFTFAHALIRETLYEELSTPRRVRLHRRIADALETLSRSRSVPLADIAYHLIQAAPAGDLEKAVDYATRAGQHAEASLAYEEATRFYEMALHALELKPTDDAWAARARGDLHAMRGRAFVAVAHWADAKPEFLAALATLGAGDLERRAQLLLSLAQAVFWLLDIDGVRPLVTEALSLAHQTGSSEIAADALAWQGRVAQCDGDIRAAIDADERAFVLNRGRVSPVLVYSPLTLHLAGRTAEAIDRGRQALDDSHRANDAGFQMFALSHYGIALAAGGRYREAFAQFDQARELGQRSGSHPLLARAVAMSAGCYLDLFDLETAESRQLEARELARRSSFVPPLVSATIDLMLTYARGADPARADALLPEVADLVAKAGGWHGWLWRLRLQHARAEVALARGDWAAALEISSASIDECLARGRAKYEVLGLLVRASAHSALGHHADSLTDRRRAVEIARRVASPALVLRAVGALMEVDGGDTLAVEARKATTQIREALPDSMRRQWDHVDLVRSASGT